jgi:hypothetical protein
MKEKIKSEAYSLHRYVDENGAPDESVIFVYKAPDKLWPRHLNPDLMRIIKNQPEEVKIVVDKHLGGCQECKNKFRDSNAVNGSLDYSDLDKHS